MTEFLNSYAVVWLAVGSAGFLICMGILLIIKATR